MNGRRRFLAVAGALAALPAWAQPATVHRIGFLLAESPRDQSARLETLRATLRQLGYIENANLAIEIRSAEGDYDRLPGLAAELVRARVEVLVAFGTKALTAAKAATKTIPIVVPSASIRQIETGAAAELSTNVVGSDNLNREVYAKRVELMKESFPRIVRLALLVNPVQRLNYAVETTLAAAASLNARVEVIEARGPGDFAAAFQSMKKARTEALLIQQDTLFSVRAPEIAKLAVMAKLPSAGIREYALAGGLIGYGASDEEFYRRAAHFIDRLLKGAKPHDLPIENAMKFELVVNMRTAKAIGATFPQSVLLRADKVID